LGHAGNAENVIWPRWGYTVVNTELLVLVVRPETLEHSVAPLVPRIVRISDLGALQHKETAPFRAAPLSLPKWLELVARGLLV
jgi:hypothetical protein